MVIVHNFELLFGGRKRATAVDNTCVPLIISPIKHIINVFPFSELFKTEAMLSNCSSIRNTFVFSFEAKGIITLTQIS